MIRAAECVLLGLLCLPAAALAQAVPAGARALVGADTLPVYAQMSVESPVRGTLKRGDTVTIALVVFGSDVTWCAVVKAGESKRLGYANCEFLDPERSPAMPAPFPAAPTPAAPVPAAPVPSTPVAVAVPPPSPAPKPEAEPPAVRPAPAPKPKSQPQPEPQVHSDAVLASLLDRSGIKASVAQYIASTKPLAFLDKARLSDLDQPALARLVSDHFQSTAFQVAMNEQLRKAYSSRHAAAVLTWLDHPGTKKMAELERRAAAEAQQKLVEFAAGITKDPPSQPRLQLIHRLNEATKFSDTEVACTIAIVRSIAQAISPLLPVAKRYGAEELRGALDAVEGRYAPIMKNARIVRYLFTYHTAEDPELERHVQFWESPGGRWLVAAAQSGYASATVRISSALKAKIPERVKALR